MTIVDVTKENECCCSCTHNKHTFDKEYHCTCTCELDGHRIGYVANFGSVCEEWERRDMSILMDWEMPKACRDCTLQIGGYCHMYTDDIKRIDDVNLIVERPEWCPLEEAEGSET